MTERDEETAEDDDPRDIDDAEDPIEPLDADDATDSEADDTDDADVSDRLPGTETPAESPIEPLAETDADKDRHAVGADDGPHMASPSDDPTGDRDDESSDDENQPETAGTTEKPVDEEAAEATDSAGRPVASDRGELEPDSTSDDDLPVEGDRRESDLPRDDRTDLDRDREGLDAVREEEPGYRDRVRDREHDRERDRRGRREREGLDGDRAEHSDRRQRRRYEGDPLDVTESDLDTDNVDEEDLDRLAELLDEARDDPDRVEGRDFEDMLGAFDDAGIDTANLEVEDLEERFDESLKVARMLVTAAANTGEYAGLAGIRAGSRMAEAAFTSRSPRDLLEETTDIARDELDRLGFPFGSPGRNDSSERDDRRSSRRSARRNDQRSDRRDGSRDDEEGRSGPIRVADLRRRGTRLLELSADVDHEEPFHPAYVRVLEQLSADEARILRLLGTEGPQPALDVYDRGFLPVGGGTLVTDGLTMLDIDAGLRYAERSNVYLDNLERLGLLEFEDDPLENLEQYRVLQAQPNVERAEERARRPTTGRRSVRLTAMGIDFCRTVFPFEMADRYDDPGPAPGSERD